MYTVKETYYTLQGEGGQTGRAAVFCRFAGCNLWSGMEKDRATAQCRFCDTDFVGTNGPGGGKFGTADSLADHIAACWPIGHGRRLVVFTGGEPLLQLDGWITSAMHDRSFEVAVETNGTVVPPAGIDWMTVSPKGRNALQVSAGTELKLVYPQPDALPERFADLQFQHWFLQPMDGPDQHANTQAALRYCLDHPQWRMSLQTHKLLRIP